MERKKLYHVNVRNYFNLFTLSNRFMRETDSQKQRRTLVQALFKTILNYTRKIISAAFFHI